MYQSKIRMLLKIYAQLGWGCTEIALIGKGDTLGVCNLLVLQFFAWNRKVVFFPLFLCLLTFFFLFSSFFFISLAAPHPFHFISSFFFSFCIHFPFLTIAFLRVLLLKKINCIDYICCRRCVFNWVYE